MKPEPADLLATPVAPDAAAVFERAALWKLFSQADELEPFELDAWLRRLEAESHPQVDALRKLIDTRDRLAASDFLETPAPFIEAPHAPSTEWAEGSAIGAYQLVKPIGSGGMAEVWLADRVDGAFQRQVAIKLLFDRPSRAQRENFAERFRRERDILAALHHPNIAGLHDAGVTASGQPWLALEYVQGDTILAWCDAKRLPVRARVQLFIQVLRAVEYAHANLVMHRDLKPGNILVTEGGEPMLLDFGIAKLIEPGQGASIDSDLTREGGRPLTLAYASPEQVLGQPLTTACDQYALGVVLYELLCGQRPYELNIGTPAEWQQAVAHTDPRAPSRRELSAGVAAERDASPKSLRRQLGEDLDAITLKALQKHPHARYASVEGLRADLSHWLSAEPVTARVPSWHYRAMKFAVRHRVGVSLASVAVVALTTAVVVASVFAVQARRESTRVMASRDALLDLFRQADPDQTSGGNVTAKDMLAGGRKRIETAFAGQPDLQASLLASVGELQGNIGDDIASKATLSRVVEIYRQRPPSRELVMALAALASEIYHAGDPDRAEGAVREASALATQFPYDPELQERVLSISGQVAWQRNDLTRGAALMRKALSEARSLYGDDDPRVLDLLSFLASLETQRGQLDEARRYVTELITRSKSIATLPTTAIYRIELQRSRINMADGRYEAARLDLGNAIPKCDVALGPMNDWCLLLDMRQAELLLREGRYADSLALVPALRRQASSFDSPRRQAESLITVCRILSANGQLQRGDPLREAVRGLSRSGDDVRQSAGVKAKAALAEAEAYLHEGNASAALVEVQVAELRVRGNKELLEDISLSGRIRMLAGVALLMQGDKTQAASSINVAKVQYEKAFGRSHPLVHLIDANWVNVLRAEGQSAEAVKLAKQIADDLQAPFGNDAPVVRRLREVGVLKGVARQPSELNNLLVVI